MKSRAQALTLCVLLLALIGGWFVTRPGAFALFMPGPTVNVLGKSDGATILEVKGHKSYRDDGQLRLVTITSTRAEDRVGLFRALQGWLDLDVDVYPYRGIYLPTDTNQSTRASSLQQMTSSKDAAVAAALSELKIKFSRYVGIVDVTKAGPSDGVLKSGDKVVSVNGNTAARMEQVIDRIRVRKPGTPIQIKVERDGKVLTRTVTTGPAGTSGQAANESRVGVTITPKFDFPFEVKVDLDEAIGGPSAGLMFALSIIDVLTPGSLTGGQAIAGTGEIDTAGRVGSIGGIRQKIVGAEQDKAKLFLVPADNCAEAVHAHYDSSKIRLVRVATLEQAKNAIETWVKNPKANLPECKGNS